MQLGGYLNHRTQKDIGHVGRVCMLLPAVLCCAAGCTNPHGFRLHVPARVTIPDRCMVMFFVDGLDHDVVEDMFARDELPAIGKYLVRRGTTVENAVTCVPTITYAIQSTLLTGLVPGHHGILGNKWFDRRSRIWKTYNDGATYCDVNNDFAAPTIFEALHDRFTVNFQAATRRGATRSIDNWAESGVCWFFQWYLALDRWVGSDFGQLDRLALEAGRWPDLVHAYFPGTDGRAHQAGSDSPAYRRALRNVDEQIGLACEALDHAGLLDRTYLLLVSDHGHTPCPREQFVDVSAWLRRTHGWRIHEGRYDRGTLEQRRRYFDRIDAAAINGGNRQYFLHVRGPDGWDTRPGFDRCREILTTGRPSLATLPAVFVGVCRKAPDQVWIVGRDGEAVVTRRRHDNAYEYRYDALSGDPLGYLGDAKLAASVREGWHESRWWLRATADTRCPDAAAQLVELFDSPRSPDIALFAADAWDFAAENVGGHGSILRRDMRVPMVFAGPGIAAGAQIGPARTCDVAPTVVELLAGPDRVREMGRIDGISLAPQLLGARAVTQLR